MIEFAGKTPFAGGASFGEVGPYERLLGTASFAIDPNEKDLPFVCDLEFAPRNADGLVEFKAVIDIVKPVDMSRGNRKLLFDFSNRGGRGAFTRLNDGGGPDYRKKLCRQRLSQSPRLHGGHCRLAGRSWSIPAATSSLFCRRRARTASRCAAKFARNLFPTERESYRCR